MIGFTLFGSVALRDKVASYKKLKVILNFNYLNNTFQIERKVNDASFAILNPKLNKYEITAKSTTAVNAKIIELLGYDYSIYVLSNYCQQGDLQAFSKMLPAKKIAFIDKVSGIEASKNMIEYLDAKRKVIKKNLEDLSKYLVLPSFSDKNYLTTDFEKELDTLEKLKDKNTKYLIEKTYYLEQIKNLEQELKALPAYKEFLPYKDFLLTANLTDILVLYKNYKKQLDNTKHVENILKAYDVPADWKNIELKDIIQYEADVDYNAKLKEKLALIKKGEVTCPSCDHTFNIAYEKLKPFESYQEPFKTLATYKNIVTLKQFITSEKSKILTILNEIAEFKLDPTWKHLFILHNFEQSVTSYYNNLSKKDQITSSVKDLKAKVIDIETYLTNNNYNKILDNYTKLQKAQVEVEIFNQAKVIYDKALDEQTFYSSQLTQIIDLIRICKEASLKIKQESIPLINYHASNLVANMTDNVITKIEVTDNYSILVDHKDIALCSGSEKDTASLAFRLSLGNSIILGMLPLFIGDEIDSACKAERADSMTKVLQNMSKNKYQIILITHKDTQNFENCKIIDLDAL